MAELLILVVIAGVVLLYAADRARKLRARARRMGAMNDRLDVAAAKVDEQQERKQARVKASAELTSVLPAIRRPPLTLPGVPGSAAGPEADDPAAVEQEAGPAAEAFPDETPAADDSTPAAASGTPAAVDDTPSAADAENTPGGAGTEQGPAAQGAPDAGHSPAAGDSPAGAEEVTPEPVRTPEGTLTMGRVTPGASPAPKLQVTSDGTLIMPPVPGQGPAPAGETVPPAAPSRARPRASQRQASQPRTTQQGTNQQDTSQEQGNRD